MAEGPEQLSTSGLVDTKQQPGATPIMPPMGSHGRRRWMVCAPSRLFRQCFSSFTAQIASTDRRSCRYLVPEIRKFGGNASVDYCLARERQRTGGRTQRFCQPSCRRAFHASVRSWALDAIADGTMTIAEIRNGAPAARALRRGSERLSPLPDIGSPGNALSYPVARFLVEVPRSTIEVLIRFGFIRFDERDDLGAIINALRRLGQAPPAIRRIA
jgi:hypothetical protein